MSIATATLRMRPPSGPALGKSRLPLTATIFSAVLHGSLAAGVVLSASFWATEKPKVYVVNLVPAVAAVGSPQGRAEAPPTPTPPPPLPPRAEEVTRPAPTRPAELPAREAPREMPPRARDAAALPDRTLPTRAPALPKAGDKELPAMASTAKAPPTPSERPTTDVARVAPPPPPVPLGRHDGSPQGSGPMTLNVSDFPFAWYLSRVQAKVTERWAGKALPGQQPVAVFEINREGQVSRLAIEKSSGNTYYDQAALRAITEANPFPPLPAEFTGQTLRVHLGFNFSAERG
ncbi:MAG TPA: TonB family protein [Methylomirabilota bacterium]|jgi:TonB family protein